MFKSEVPRPQDCIDDPAWRRTAIQPWCRWKFRRIAEVADRFFLCRKHEARGFTRKRRRVNAVTFRRRHVLHPRDGFSSPGYSVARCGATSGVRSGTPVKSMLPLRVDGSAPTDGGTRHRRRRADRIRQPGRCANRRPRSLASAPIPSLFLPPECGASGDRRRRSRAVTAAIAALHLPQD